MRIGRHFTEQVEQERRRLENERNEKRGLTAAPVQNFIKPKAVKLGNSDERKIRRMKNKQNRLRRQVRNRKRHGRQ